MAQAALLLEAKKKREIKSGIGREGIDGHIFVHLRLFCADNSTLTIYIHICRNTYKNTMAEVMGKK
jgi:hypothetical protein